MEEMDNRTTDADASLAEHDDEQLMMDHVIKEEHDLFYLHCCLEEILGS